MGVSLSRNHRKDPGLRLSILCPGSSVNPKCVVPFWRAASHVLQTDRLHPPQQKPPIFPSFSSLSPLPESLPFCYFRCCPPMIPGLASLVIRPAQPRVPRLTKSPCSFCCSCLLPAYSTCWCVQTREPTGWYPVAGRLSSVSVHIIRDCPTLTPRPSCDQVSCRVLGSTGFNLIRLDIWLVLLYVTLSPFFNRTSIFITLTYLTLTIC